MHKLIVLLLLVSAMAMGCDTKQAEESSGAMSDAAVLASVEAQVVTTTSFTRTRAFVGNISASKSVKVIPLTSERILKFPWENGDFVKKGDVIAEIRNDVSRKGLDALNAQMKSVDAQLSAAQRELKRVQSMYESNIVSRQNYDQAQDAVTTLQASKLQLQASLEQTRLGLDYARVVAPIDGVVSQKNSEVGDIASSAMPLCILLDLSVLKVTMNINEADAAYMKLGQDVKLRFDAYPGEVVTAHVTRIMPYVNTSTRTNTVEAEFDNVMNETTGQYRYKPGMYTRAEVGLETTMNAVAVPPTALILEPELLVEQVPGQTLRKVFVVKPDNTVESRIVELGEQNGNIVEIKSGLKPGDILVTRGHHTLRNGDPVKIKNDPNAEKAAEAAPVAEKAETAPAAAQAEPAAQEAAPAPENSAPAENPAPAPADAEKTTP